MPQDDHHAHSPSSSPKTSPKNSSTSIIKEQDGSKRKLMGPFLQNAAASIASTLFSEFSEDDTSQSAQCKNENDNATPHKTKSQVVFMPRESSLSPQHAHGSALTPNDPLTVSANALRRSKTLPPRYPYGSKTGAVPQSLSQTPSNASVANHHPSVHFDSDPRDPHAPRHSRETATSSNSAPRTIIVPSSSTTDNVTKNPLSRAKTLTSRAKLKRELYYSPNPLPILVTIKAPPHLPHGGLYSMPSNMERKIKTACCFRTGVRWRYEPSIQCYIVEGFDEKHVSTAVRTVQAALNIE